MNDFQTTNIIALLAALEIQCDRINSGLEWRISKSNEMHIWSKKYTDSLETLVQVIEKFLDFPLTTES